MIILGGEIVNIEKFKGYIGYRWLLFDIDGNYLK